MKNHLSPLYLFLLIVGMGCWNSCQNGTAQKYPTLSLLSQGMPVSVLAPDSAQIKTEDWIVQKTVVLTSEPDNYFMRVSSRPAKHFELAAAKTAIREEVEEGDSFHEVVEDKSSGFIFGKKLDSALVSYDFRHLELKGDRLYVFQIEMVPQVFSLEEAREMYRYASAGK